MKILTAVAVIAATMLTAAPANSERFVIVAAEAQDSMVAIDLDTIRDVAGYRRAWLTTVVMDSAYLKPIFAQTLYQFDCKAERSQMLSGKMFGDDQKFIDDVTGNSSWEFPAPSTSAYLALSYACGKAAKEDEVLNISAYQMFKAFVGTRTTARRKK
ncbi:hypothetical protein C8J25_107266 [Sphingomonas faeni]|uniref:Surface-adhesin protein E-like domain-containing protein n=1 Tax=Sphingomonas faeni TaxID=185950 RepID=A0A2T5U260_9SPHN|nr:surface-adhesin E family protein [Sphingomonas faeni]PTW45581.1 hypothetical protein C8J25_107266 [Sphingomonas faeni]